MGKIFLEHAPGYWAAGHSVIPVPPGTKRGIPEWSNYIDNAPKDEKREQWLGKYADHGIALACGGKIDDLHKLVGLDIDDERYVGPISRMVGKVVSAKKGNKGLTIFVRAELDVPKTQIPSSGARILDVLARKAICVLPPTIHPETGQPYEWIGASLLDCSMGDLPVLTAEKFAVMRAILTNPNHEGLI